MLSDKIKSVLRESSPHLVSFSLGDIAGDYEELQQYIHSTKEWNQLLDEMDRLTASGHKTDTRILKARLEMTKLKARFYLHGAGRA